MSRNYDPPDPRQTALLCKIISSYIDMAQAADAGMPIAEQFQPLNAEEQQRAARALQFYLLMKPDHK